MRSKEQGVQYPILLGADEELAKALRRALGFPRSWWSDPDGRIDSVHVGLIEPDELESGSSR